MRFTIERLEECFTKLNEEMVAIVENSPESSLFEDGGKGEITPKTPPVVSVVRAAAVVEQVFGGLTTRLWDDPFEWTLPEALNDRQSILSYLDDVKKRQSEVFGRLQTDADLQKTTPAPVEIMPIFTILLRALTRSWYLLGIARANLGHRNIDQQISS